MGLTCFWGGGEVDQAGHGLCSDGWMLKFSLRRETLSKDTGGESLPAWLYRKIGPGRWSIKNKGCEVEDMECSGTARRPEGLAENEVWGSRQEQWSRDTTEETDLGNQLEQKKKDPLPLGCESFSNVSLRSGALSGGQSVPGQRFYRIGVVSLPLASYLTGLMPFQYSCN